MCGGSAPRVSSSRPQIRASREQSRGCRHAGVLITTLVERMAAVLRTNAPGFPVCQQVEDGHCLRLHYHGLGLHPEMVDASRVILVHHLSQRKHPNRHATPSLCSHQCSCHANPTPTPTPVQANCSPDTRPLNHSAAYSPPAPPTAQTTPLSSPPFHPPTQTPPQKARNA